MGQKMDPHGLRVGVIKDWSSKWYADSKNFSEYLIEDYKIRELLKKKLFVAGISKIEIERTAKLVKINVYTAKPGLVIGKGGNLAETIKANKSDIFIKSDEKSTLNIFAIVGDWHINPSKKGFLTDKNLTNGDIQRNFLDKTIDYVKNLFW